MFQKIRFNNIIDCKIKIKLESFISNSQALLIFIYRLQKYPQSLSLVFLSIIASKKLNYKTLLNNLFILIDNVVN